MSDSSALAGAKRRHVLYSILNTPSRTALWSGAMFPILGRLPGALMLQPAWRLRPRLYVPHIRTNDLLPLALFKYALWALLFPAPRLVSNSTGVWLVGPYAAHLWSFFASGCILEH